MAVKKKRTRGKVIKANESETKSIQSFVSHQTRSLASLIKELDELEKHLEEFEDFLQTVGDDAQLANIDLQNQLQKQQQTLQLMSNVSKMIHDTILAEIRKIG